MNMLRKVVENAAIGVAVADRAEDLDLIRRPGCAAAIWRRQPALSFQTWLEKLDPDLLPKARVILRPKAVRDELQKLFQSFDTPVGPEQDALIDDATMLADRFAQMMTAPYVRLRLDRVTTNACRRFHIDALSARLVCTYRGTGTQYGISTDGADPGRVFTVPTGSPIVLRGTLWPETPKSGLLHRSPPIEGTGETRLVLVLDPIYELENV